MPDSDRDIFYFVMIKPTHYDDDGYPLQWWKSYIPSNTLAVLNGLFLDCKERQVLGPDVELRGIIVDETNTRVRPDRIMKQIAQAGARALIGFVGVQTNQFPRAVDLARPFIDGGYPVVIGGFHVSGCLAMLKELPPDIRAAQDMGISLFAGETEERRLDEVLRDAQSGTLKPLYDYMNALPTLQHQPYPILPRETVGQVSSDFASFDLGRGCPYQCSFCTIINVQGRKSRFRSAADLEAIIRHNHSLGIRKFFVTDDDLARNKNWEAFFDTLIALRKDLNCNIELTIQVDTACHRIPNFIEKALAAGVIRVFIGLENINPENLIHAQKRQNKITDYRAMLQKWRDGGAVIIAGYIIGFPNDTKASVLRDVEIVKRELPIDLLEFFYLTPLPGSADHKRDQEAGRWMDADMNKYDAAHRVTHHAKMSDAEWEETYDAAWRSYYSWDHIETVGKRAAVLAKGGVKVNELVEFLSAYDVEGVHPLEGGLLRKKVRRDRRPELPMVHPLLFYPAFAAETVTKLIRHAVNLNRAKRLDTRLRGDPNRHLYSDLAITPPAPEEFEALGLFQETRGADGAIRRKQVQDGALTLPAAE